MNNRNPLRPGLTIHTESDFLGHPVLKSRDGLIENYLYRIYKTLNTAVEEHPRTWAVRIDLRLPRTGHYRSDVISKFIRSLRKRVETHSRQKKNAGKRVHPCTIRYIWTKERDSAVNFHYHVLLLFNKDTYRKLGDYDATEGNMSARIKSSWASALGLEFSEAARLIHYPKNCNYYLNRKDPEYQQDFDELFRRVSYFAKPRTKVYGNGERSFDYSYR